MKKVLATVENDEDVEVYESVIVSGREIIKAVEGKNINFEIRNIGDDIIANNLDDEDIQGHGISIKEWRRYSWYK